MLISTIFAVRIDPSQIRMKKGEVRVKEHKAQIQFKAIDPRDKDQTLEAFVEKEMQRITKLREMQGGKAESKKEQKKEARRDSKKEGKRAKSAISHPVDVPIPKRSRFSKGTKTVGSS